MTPTPQDSGADQPLLWGAVAAVLAVVIAWAKRADPRLILVWLNEPLMRKHIDPVNAKLDRVCRVIDRLPGADDAHAAVSAEDTARKKRWEA